MGVEFSEQAVKEFFADHKLQYTSEQVGPLVRYKVRHFIPVICISRTGIVSTLKGRLNRYSLSEVLTIRGAYYQRCLLSKVLTIRGTYYPRCFQWYCMR